MRLCRATVETIAAHGLESVPMTRRYVGKSTRPMFKCSGLPRALPDLNLWNSADTVLYCDSLVVLYELCENHKTVTIKHCFSMKTIKLSLYSTASAELYENLMTVTTQHCVS